MFKYAPLPRRACSVNPETTNPDRLQPGSLRARLRMLSVRMCRVGRSIGAANDVKI